jgi:hypothetical protein
MNPRGRAQPPRTSRPPTTHIATRPGDVWCWDVTVERKTRRWSGRERRPGDRAQVLAYCLLVEETWGQNVKTGLLNTRILNLLFSSATGRALGGSDSTRPYGNP